MTDADAESPPKPTFVVTLELDAASFAVLQAWRTRHFPPAVNYLPAHLTLLHTVSARQVDQFRDAWPSLALSAPLHLRFAAPRYLGRGVAVVVESQELQALRARVIQAMGGEFTRQDQQPSRAHITIQNKVAAGLAKTLFESLHSNFEPWQGRGEGVLIWRYLGGPWALESEHRFQG